MRRLVMSINKTECRIPSCHNTFVYGNNGLPLIQGEVCDDCNDLVVMARINLMNGVWSET
jgi:hypothetical protein